MPVFFMAVIMVAMLSMFMVMRGVIVFAFFTFGFVMLMGVRAGTAAMIMFVFFVVMFFFVNRVIVIVRRAIEANTFKNLPGIAGFYSVSEVTKLTPEGRTAFTAVIMPVMVVFVRLAVGFGHVIPVYEPNIR